MRSFFRRHVAARLALIWLAVAIPLSAVLLFTFIAWYAARVTFTQQERQGYAQTVAGEFELLLGGIRYDLRVAGADVAEAPSSTASVEALERIVREHPAAYAVFADTAGRILGASSRPSSASVAGDEAFEAALRAREGFGLEPSEDASGGLVGFHVAQSIPGRTGREAGVMLVFVDVRRLHDEFPVEVPFGGISVVDSAGQVVYQNESVRFAETRAQWGDRFPFVRQALDGRAARTLDFEFPTGGTRIGVFVPIEPIGWAAGSSIDPAAALAPVYRTLAISVLVSVLVGGLALFVSIATSRGVLRSLEDLAADAARIGSGELEEPVLVEREDEIGGVARSLEAARTGLLEARQRAGEEVDTTQTLLRAAEAFASPIAVEEVLATIARFMADVSGCSRVTVDLLDREANQFVVAYMLGEPAMPFGTTVPAGFIPSPVEPQLLAGRPIEIDFEALPLTAESASFFERFQVRYALAVPLVAYGNVLGVIGIDEPGQRHGFNERTIRVAEGIGPQAALAIENARRFQEQSRGRELAETLDEVGRLIHASLGSTEGVQQALELAGARLGAPAAALFLDSDGISVARYQYGFPSGFLGSRYGGDVFPFARLMVESREPIAVGEAQLEELMNAEVARQFNVRSLLAIPLLGRGGVVGGIGFVFSEPYAFTTAESDFARKLGTTVSLAIENASLYEAERERARLGRSMIEITADLASTLDISETLPAVLRKTCVTLGGFGATVLDRVEGGWRIRHVAGPGAKGLEKGDFLVGEQVPTLSRILETRAPHAVADTATADDVNRSLAERVGYRAYATYPLIVRGEIMGALSVVFEQPHAFSAEELDYLRRAAFAISLAEENYRLYEAEHRIAETLQTAMLALPEHVPGVEFAHVYRSATQAARVGGDFYDLFELEHRLVGIVVGDISGHGIDAAVLTSLVKNAIRVQATEQQRKPNEVVASAGRLLYDNSPPELFATVFFGVLHLDDGLLEYCSAGHTTSACVCSDGGVRQLVTNSPLIGAFAGDGFELSTDRLDVHDLLFLYTDGLTEARRDGELYGEARLFELLSRDRGGDPERTMRKVMDDVLAFSRDVLADDLAILAVQRSGAG